MSVLALLPVVSLYRGVDPQATFIRDVVWLQAGAMLLLPVKTFRVYMYDWTQKTSGSVWPALPDEPDEKETFCYGLKGKLNADRSIQ